ncbi:cinnamyl-alcohol dehydrogenase [Ranunculus cassubicifolius]
MGFQGFTVILLPLFLLSLCISSTSGSKNFMQCLTAVSDPSISNTLYSPNNSSYTSILDFSIQNRVFMTSTTPKPQFIITPQKESHIQAAVICSKKLGYQIRVRSGGHDYEGLSYLSYQPFVIIDLVKFQDINVNIKENTAWVQAGATVGQVYYRIAEQSNTHGFPASVCPTVGVGGLIGGGGLGFLWRKYGLSADNVVDAYIVDVNGKLLNRKSMGEDLFWAIRGGGGSSFGVIVAWKIQLVRVPPTVTVFRLAKTLEQGATNLFYTWQNIAHRLPKDLLIRTIIQPVQGNNGRTIQVTFESTFQGRLKALLPLMEKNFPELGLKAEDCTEMSWVNSTLFVDGLSGPVDILLNRSMPSKNFFKAESDFVKKPISISDLESIWKVMLSADEDISPQMITEPMGGRMAEISESASPFPNRKGNLYNIQYFLTWQNGSATPRFVEAARRLYNFTTPFVSKSPRARYVNYRDLDIGVNKDVNTSYEEARVWGESYFGANFERLAVVKGKVDPENYFWNEQSIPPFAPTRCCI